MPSDLASLLREAAPQPGAPVDPAGLWAEGRRRRTRRRLAIVLAATAAVAALAGSTVVLLDGSGTDGAVTSITDRRGDSGAIDGAFRPEDFLPASRELVVALQNERSAATAHLVGVDSMVAPGQDSASARAAADSAIARFNDVAAGEPVGSAVESAEIPEALRELRRDVDASARPATLAESPLAAEISGRYGDLIATVLDTNTGLARALDDADFDPDLRLAVVLYDEGLRQTEVRSLLLAEILLGVTSQSLDTADGIARVAELHGDQVRGRSYVRGRADGTVYEEAAEALDSDLAGDGAEAAVADVIETGEVAMPRLLESLPMSPDRGWPAFLDRVEATMASDGPAGGD